MLRRIWDRDALADLRRITFYIGQRNYPAALRLRELMENSAEKLPLHPYYNRPGRVLGTREAVVHPNYILIYRVRRDYVRSLAVLHSRQDYP